MTAEQFLLWANLIPDPLLLVSGMGDILASNRSARSLGFLANQIVGKNLADFVQDPQERLADFLAQARRTRDGVPGSFLFSCHPNRLSCEAALLKPAQECEGGLLLLRLPCQDTLVNRFSLLNEKINALNEEVEKRTLAEKHLQEQHDLAAFGRDIGLILAHSDGMSEMLQKCAELLVKTFRAAFARFWTLDESSQTLILKASAGVYTHLDGEHSRIKVGQFKIGAIAQEQRPRLTNQVIGHPQIHNQDWARKTNMMAFAGYPLIVDERTVGVMALFSQHSLGANTIEAMASVAQMIALGIERKRVEEDLTTHAQALEAADRRKDEFLAMLAHELRNPLAPIRSGLELLMRKREDHDILTIMYEHVQHMVRLVDDLLDVSRIMRERITLQCEPLLLNQLIERVVTSLQPQIEERQHQLVVHACSTPLWIDGDPVRISQVLFNLLNNAIKYTPAGGRIEIAYFSVNGHVEILLKDNGIGIEPEFLSRVFDLFSQADQSLDRSAGGLGIGLTLVERIVHLHKGRISVHSEGAGQGCEVHLVFPVLENPPEEIDKPDDPEICDQQHRILVVDDIAGLAEIFKRLLFSLGQSQVELAHDGPSAIEVAKAFQPDLIFLDIGLPGMDGYGVVRVLRALPEFAQTTIVALTGYGTQEAKEKSAEAGFTHHLVKPVSVQQLTELFTSMRKLTIAQRRPASEVP